MTLADRPDALYHRNVLRGNPVTDRERFLATLTFDKPDRIPFTPGGGRESTLAKWHQQGLPSDVKDYHSYLRELIGIEPASDPPKAHPGVKFTMIPEFEQKVLEHRPAAPGSTKPGVLVVQDWKGNICEISDAFDVSYLRDAPDFVTRSWLKCPVESRDDWENMAQRYTPDDPDRWPGDWLERCQKLKDRAQPVGLVFPGPFWQLREWLGFESLCMLFLDDADFVRTMVSFWQAFVSQLLSEMFKDFVPDFVMVNEDMAYKEKPMIGASMSEQFLLPCWRQWGDLCRDAKVPLYGVDSDGHVGQLIPVWLEAGLHFTSPLEVAAGNDLPAYRQQYGKQMAYMGGVDKRAMAKGGKVIAREIDRLKPAVQAGGFIPSCDHGVPADVSWPNFVEYARLLAKITGWL